MKKKDILTVDIKTLWNGKAWVHPKYLRRAKALGKGLTLIYKKEVMEIPADRIDVKYWTKGDREYYDKFNPCDPPYVLWGIHFVKKLKD